MGIPGNELDHFARVLAQLEELAWCGETARGTALLFWKGGVQGSRETQGKLKAMGLGNLSWDVLLLVRHGDPPGSVWFHVA